MSNIVSIRERLWNPPNGRNSTELEIVTGSERRKQRNRELSQREEMRRAAEDFKRQSELDDLLRRVLAEHIRAKTIAARIIEEEAPVPPSVRQILRLVSATYEIPVSDILSRRRTGRVIEPRQVAMYLARTLTFNSFPTIGHLIGDRDHTTIYHGYERIKQRMLGDVELKRKVIQLQKMLVQKNDQSAFAVPA